MDGVRDVNVLDFCLTICSLQHATSVCFSPGKRNEKSQLLKLLSVLMKIHKICGCCEVYSFQM